MNRDLNDPHIVDVFEYRQSPEQAALQEKIEACFLWAFARAAEVRMLKRAQRAFADLQEYRKHSPEGLLAHDLRAVTVMQQRLVKSGVAAAVLARPMRFGLALRLGPMDHICWSQADVDAALTVAAGRNK